MLFGWPIPLLPIHLLWVNLITDAFPALALGMEKKEPNIMNMPPRNPDEPIINRDMRTAIIVQSTVLTIAVLGSFYFALAQYNNLPLARTYAFVTLVIAELLRAYTTRSERYLVWKIGFFSNRSMTMATIVSLVMLFLVLLVPALEQLFKLEPFHMKDWYIVLAFAVLPFLSGEISKLVKHWGKR